MIDIEKAHLAFEKFLKSYQDQTNLGFELKVTHTYHVVENAKLIATQLNLSDEEKKLAELIALLHDIGRFEEITFLKQFDSVKFNHALYSVKMLFDDNLIRDFVKDEQYDEIIKSAISNHNKLKIEKTLTDRSLLHAKIIRDADKLDNFRVKKEETIEAIFPGKVKSEEEIESATLSNQVYEAILKEECVDIRERITPLDYWVCVLAFIFDLNFKSTYEIIKENHYIDSLIDRFQYRNEGTREQMEQIRKILNSYIETKINSSQQ